MKPGKPEGGKQVGERMKEVSHEYTRREKKRIVGIPSDALEFIRLKNKQG